MPSSSALPVFASLLLAAASSAQSPPPNQGGQGGPNQPWPGVAGRGADKPNYWIDWPAPLLPRVFERSVALDLDGDRVRDVVVLGTRTPYLVYGPGEYAAVIDLATQANDIEALLRPFGSDGYDQILCVGTGGLALVGWDPVTRTFPITPLDSTLWVNARTVRSLDLDGDGDRDVLGLSGDGLRLLSMLQGHGLAFVPGATRVLGRPAETMEVFQWDGAGAFEVATAGGGGLEVRGLDGTLLYDFDASSIGPVTENRLARLRYGGEGRQRLAWLGTAHPAGVAQRLLAILKDNAIVDGLDVTALGVPGMCAGDWNQDGSDELFLSVEVQHAVLRLHNTWNPSNPISEDVFDFAYSTAILVGTAQPCIANRADPLVLDFDNDGDPDLFFPVQDDLRFYCGPGEAVRADSQRPQIKNPVLESGMLSFQLKHPLMRAPAARTVFVDLWRQADITSNADTISLIHVVRDVPANWATVPMTIDLPLPETGSTFPAVYTVHARVVETQGAGRNATVMASYPARVMGYATDFLAIATLQQEAIENAMIQVYDGISDDPTLGGKFVPRANVRPFHAGAVPKFGPTSP